MSSNTGSTPAWIFSSENMKYSTEFDAELPQCPKRVFVFQCNINPKAFFVLERYFENSSRISRILASFNGLEEAKGYARKVVKDWAQSHTMLGPHETQNAHFYPGQVFIER